MLRHRRLVIRSHLLGAKICRFHEIFSGSGDAITFNLAVLGLRGVVKMFLDFRECFLVGTLILSVLIFFCLFLKCDGDKIFNIGIFLVRKEAFIDITIDWHDCHYFVNIRFE